MWRGNNLCKLVPVLTHFVLSQGAITSQHELIDNECDAAYETNDAEAKRMSKWTQHADNYEYANQEIDKIRHPYAREIIFLPTPFRRSNRLRIQERAFTILKAEET